jgi:hypothetical protein
LYFVPVGGTFARSYTSDKKVVGVLPFFRAPLQCLQQSDLATDRFKIVSDNARISVVGAQNDDQEPERPSLVAEKIQLRFHLDRNFVDPLAPKLPSRRVSIDLLASFSAKVHRLSSELQPFF